MKILGAKRKCSEKGKGLLKIMCYIVYSYYIFCLFFMYKLNLTKIKYFLRKQL